MNYYCIFCKGSVNDAEPDLMKLDPCKLILIPQFDNNEGDDQDYQPFYCHFACFRQAIREDSMLAFWVAQDPDQQALPGSGPWASHEPAPSEDDENIQKRLDNARPDIAQEELPLLEAGLAGLVSDLERYGEGCGVWEKLLTYPRGRWTALADLLPDHNPIYDRITDLDPFIKPREDILITWVDDFYNRSRPFENQRLVLVTLDSGYDWMRKIIIPLERPDRPDPRCIP